MTQTINDYRRQGKQENDLIFIGLVFWKIAPGLSNSQPNWQQVGQATPAKLRQKLQQDYTTYLRPDISIDINQMRLLKLQEPGSLSLYLINTRAHTVGQPERTPSCGRAGCLFLGYVPDQDGFKQVLNGWINDFQVQGAPPVIQAI